jgi:hypothetical protein
MSPVSCSQVPLMSVGRTVPMTSQAGQPLCVTVVATGLRAVTAVQSGLVASNAGLESRE